MVNQAGQIHIFLSFVNQDMAMISKIALFCATSDCLLQSSYHDKSGVDSVWASFLRSVLFVFIENGVPIYTSHFWRLVLEWPASLFSSYSIVVIMKQAELEYFLWLNLRKRMRTNLTICALAIIRLSFTYFKWKVLFKVKFWLYEEYYQVRSLTNWFWSSKRHKNIRTVAAPIWPTTVTSVT